MARTCGGTARGSDARGGFCGGGCLGRRLASSCRCRRAVLETVLGLGRASVDRGCFAGTGRYSRGGAAVGLGGRGIGASALPIWTCIGRLMLRPLRIGAGGSVPRGGFAIGAGEGIAALNRALGAGGGAFACGCITFWSAISSKNSDRCLPASSLYPYRSWK